MVKQSKILVAVKVPARVNNIDKAIGMLYGLRYGATWFLYFTNAETRIRRLFGMKEAVDSSYTGQMKAKMKSMFGGA